MSLVCVNKGGETSRIRLVEPVVLEQPQTIAVSADCVDAWQLRVGQILTAEGDKGYYRCRLVALQPPAAEVIPFQPLQSPESPLELTLVQAIPARERFELVLEKLVELGVRRIVPLVTQRSSTRAMRDSTQAKSHRWPEVVRRAAVQCRRSWVPELTDEIDLDSFLALSPAWTRLVLDEQETTERLLSLELQPTEPLCLIVGPEGGFTDDERHRFQQHGVRPVSLGARLLRTETAAIVGTALVQSRWGDLG